VFNGCCRDVALETYPALALTALCPNRESDYDRSVFPDGLFTYSRLRLNTCLYLDAANALVSPDDVPWHKVSSM
jgi:hypothetical protein